jgi:hypothetical protein
MLVEAFVIVSGAIEDISYPNIVGLVNTKGVSSLALVIEPSAVNKSVSTTTFCPVKRSIFYF